MANDEPFDEVSDSPTKSTPKRVVSQFTFYATQFLIFFSLQIGEMLLIKMIALYFGWNESGSLVSGFAIVNLALSYVIANQFFKWLGLSRSRKTTEIQTTTQYLTHVTGGSEEPVSIRPSMVPLGVICIVFAIIIAAILFVVPAQQQKGMICGYLLCIFFLIAGFYLIYATFWGKPNLLADDAGLTCYGIRSHRIKRGFFPWSEVFTYEIVRHFDTWGKCKYIAITLKDLNKKQIVVVDLRMAKPVEQERFVKFIKAKLPESIPEN